MSSSAVPKTGRTGVSGAGPVFEQCEEPSKQPCASAFKSTSHDVDRFERSMPEERERSDRQFQREEIGKVVPTCDPLRSVWIEARATVPTPFIVCPGS